MAHKYADRIRSREKKFWLIAAIFFFILVVSTIIAYRCLGDARYQNADNLLKGPPQFIVLSLVVALAVYLRQLAAGAMEFRDKIRNERVRLYPSGQRFTEAKAKNLERIYEILGLTTPFLIALALVLSLRIVFDSILRFESSVFADYRWVLTVADFLIAEWLFWFFLFLAALHFFLRRTDERIRAAARDYENEHPPPIRESVGTRRADLSNIPKSSEPATEDRSSRIAPISVAATGIVILSLVALLKKRA